MPISKTGGSEFANEKETEEEIRGLKKLKRRIKEEEELGLKARILKDLEGAYLTVTDWEVKENANVNRSYGAFLGYVIDKILKNPLILSTYLPSEAISEHFEGSIHIHKLPHSLFIPYCAGWSLSKILKKGLDTPTVISNPAKHLDTAVSHLVNFFFLAAQEWTGAQAVTAFDLYMAPFVRYDNADKRMIKQALQRMVFELNYPSRIGYQSPFTNITLVLDTAPDFLEGDAYVGGKRVGSLGDYLDEALRVTESLFTLYLEGDARGQPFTFPIITMMLTKNFDWNGSRWGYLTDLFFEVLAKRGSFYLLNGYSTDVSGLYAMCCRLTIDAKKAANAFNSFKLTKNEEDEVYDALKSSRRGWGIWALPDATGSIGVITINLPRLAIEANGDLDSFYDFLYEKLEIARSVLLTWRERYLKSIENGLLPLTKIYIGHLAGHFNTFGVIGLPETAMNILGDPNPWNSSRRAREAISIMKSIVRTIRKMAEEYEEEDGYLYNVEEVPGESASFRLALADYNRFGDLVKSGKVIIPLYMGKPFYSNSIVPYYADVPLARRVELEAEVQQEFTGGVMLHLFMYEAMDPKALKKLVYNIVTRTKIVYFSITPSISVCRKCGWRGVGIHYKCPKCGSMNIDIWSRIVGYYRPIRTWNDGKKVEFNFRIHYGTEKRLRPVDVLEND